MAQEGNCVWRIPRLWTREKNCPMREKAKAWYACGKPLPIVDAEGCHASVYTEIRLMCLGACACSCCDSKRCQVGSQCLCLLFLLSFQSKTTPFTYSAHCNSSVRFIPVRLKEVSGMSLIVNQIRGSKLLDNCCNNQCIVACMDIYRQVTHFTDILSVHSTLFMRS